MTALATLDRRTAAVEAVRAQAEPYALAIVARHLDDARAHAALAASSRRPSWSPGLTAALARLDALAGLLSGGIADVRESAYRVAWDAHRIALAEHAPAVLRPLAAPEGQAIEAVRHAAVHGYDLAALFRPPIELATRTLRAAVAHAAGRAGTQPLDTWRVQAGDRFRSAVLAALSDSVEYADRRAGADLVRPELIDDTLDDD